MRLSYTNELALSKTMLKNKISQFDRLAKIIKCGETADFYVREENRQSRKIMDNGQMRVDN